jgi:hypothetical protein
VGNAADIIKDNLCSPALVDTRVQQHARFNAHCINAHQLLLLLLLLLLACSPT